MDLYISCPIKSTFISCSYDFGRVVVASSVEVQVFIDEKFKQCVAAIGHGQATSKRTCVQLTEYDSDGAAIHD